jgi:hypothetical protein
MRLFKKNDDMEVTKVWKWYDHGQDWHRANSLYTDTEMYYNFVEANQWAGIESGDERLPFYDFITGIVEHKTAMVAMNAVTINYSPLNTGKDRATYQQACDLLNEFAVSKWELTKMDTAMWDMVNAACITGDSYLFFYDRELNHQRIDRTDIYFADEQEKDVQKQRRIIIYERRLAEDVKEDARKNGLKQEEIDKIVGDEDTENLPEAAKHEVKGEEKCGGLLCLEKKPLPAPHVEPYGIFISRSTQTVIYQPEKQVIGYDENGQPTGRGITMFPIVKMMWYPKRGSSRGIGEVKRQINNQIASNKNLYRRVESVKKSAFPKPVASTDMLSNPEDADKVGVTMRVKGVASKATDAFGYVAPQSSTSEPKELQEELITTSRDLANAGDNATGNINPEQASGAAIIAVRDQQALPANKPRAYFKQLVEDIAAVWLDTWTAYNPNGLTIDTEEVDESGLPLQKVIPAEVLQRLKAKIRIDVSPAMPFDKFALQQQIDNLVSNPIFQDTAMLEEYHDLIDDSNPIKGKISDLLEKRRAALEAQEQALSAQLQAQLEKALGIIQQQDALLAQYQGGIPNGTSYTPTA